VLGLILLTELLNSEFAGKVEVLINNSIFFFA